MPIGNKSYRMLPSLGNKQNQNGGRIGRKFTIVTNKARNEAQGMNTQEIPKSSGLEK